MPVSVKILGAKDYADSFDEREAFALDVLSGLSAARKSIPSKYFYDRHGSELFRRITRLPEYYLTGCELEILESRWERIAACVAGSPSTWWSSAPDSAGRPCYSWNGSGNPGLDFQYVPIDISASSMDGLVDSVDARFPDLHTQGLVGDYFHGLKWLNHRYRRRNLVLFLGSSIGNFTREESCFFLRSAWKCLNHNDLMLIGFDLKKDIDVLLRGLQRLPGTDQPVQPEPAGAHQPRAGGALRRGQVSPLRHLRCLLQLHGELPGQPGAAVAFIGQIGRSFAFEAWNRSTPSIPASTRFRISNGSPGSPGSRSRNTVRFLPFLHRFHLERG